MAKILLVEDNHDLGDALKALLGKENHVTDLVRDGLIALEMLRDYEYDVIILDVQLPGCNGFEVLKQFRANGGTTPIIMLTSRNAARDKEEGLDSGADDYLTKPFEPSELSARIRVQLRRPATPTYQKVLVAGDITLDPTAFVAKKGTKEIHLQPMEFSLLEFFMRHPNEVFSVEALQERVWPSDSEASPEGLRVYINYLRRKIDDKDGTSYIQTLHRKGYRFVVPPK